MISSNYGLSLKFGWLIALSLTTQLSGKEIKGVIIEAETRAPIGGVFVTTSDSSDFIITQSDGLFQFSSIDSDVIVLKAARNGYQTVTDTLKIKKMPHLEIVMYPKITQLGETIVTDRKISSQTAEPVTRIKRAELRGRIKNTIAETLSNKAGFAQRSSGPTTAPGPIITPRSSSARGSTIAEGWTSTGLSAVIEAGWINSFIVLSPQERTSDRLSKQANHQLSPLHAPSRTFVF